MVTRESAFDDVTMSRIEALQAYEESLCPAGCGQLASECNNPESIWAVDTFKCMATRAKEQVEAKDREKNEDHPERLDGVFWYPRPYDPERDLDSQGRRPRRPKQT